VAGQAHRETGHRPDSSPLVFQDARRDQDAPLKEIAGAQSLTRTNVLARLSDMATVASVPCDPTFEMSANGCALEVSPPPGGHAVADVVMSGFV
jgi:hypothetical protein